MRCFLFVAALSTLSLEVAADASTKGKPLLSSSVHSNKEKKHQATEYADEGAEVDERQLAVSTTKKGFNWKAAEKIAGPVVGGVVGAGALAGVIAISVIGRTTPKPGPAGQAKAVPKPVVQPFVVKATLSSTATTKGSYSMTVANQGGFHVGDKVMIDQYTPQQEVAQIASFGSLVFQNPLKFAHPAGTRVSTVPPNKGFFAAREAAPASGTAAKGDSSSTSDGNVRLFVLGGALLALCLASILAMALFSKKKKKKVKRVPTQETYEPMEERQPLNEDPYEGAQSQYMPVGGQMEQSLYRPVNRGAAAMPTLDAIPMQTMPPTRMPGMSAMPTAYNAASPLAQTAAAMPTAYNLPQTVYR